MKTTRRIMRQLSIVMIAVLSFSSLQAPAAVKRSASPEKDQSIMIALLLDTSNSMDGLIDQAKSQLWRIVNELASAKCSDGARPRIRIALYEYGNDGLPSSEGYVRQVSGLTSDLDLISEKLFSLKTNGGSEFCGYVINASLKELDWSASNGDLKMIFIAGNEPFTQGPIPYHMACSLAKEKDVVVNTIFCGPFSEGVETSWKAGADLTGGNYMSIEQDKRTVYIATPYDDRINTLNDQLNKTYIYYGSHGEEKKAKQAAQDANAASFGAANKAERAISKSTHAYVNSEWDLVDATKDDSKIVENAKPESLPKEMQRMSVEQRKAYVAEKAAERSRIQKEIQQLNVKRQQYIDQKNKEAAVPEDKMLDATMIKAVKAQARSKSLRWE